MTPIVMSNPQNWQRAPMWSEAGSVEIAPAPVQRITCTKTEGVKPDWKCLRDAGHDGPCALAPLTGSGACPDIKRCLAHGCRAKCGPDEGRRPGWWARLQAWLIGTPCAEDCLSPCCHYGCENSLGHRW